MKLSSPVLTPNNDGVNDRVVIEYDLLNLAGTVPASVDVYSLSGQRLSSVPIAGVASGRFSTQWDGRDDGGKILPPGMYILRLEVAADQSKDSVERIISLAY